MIMEFIKCIYEAIKRLIDWVITIIKGILKFFEHIKKWFLGLGLRHGLEIPFIADKKRLKDMIKTAPVKNVGIFAGVYNEELDEITHAQEFQAYKADDTTKKLLKKDPLVVLE